MAPRVARSRSAQRGLLVFDAPRHTMFHGDLATITARGILLHRKTVQHLGIFGHSQCWGLWVENPLKEGSTERTRDHQHLVISPFHPSSWPFLIRLQLWMVDRIGAMNEMASLLERCGLSILYSECAFSGFGHATWNVVAEVVDVGPALEDLWSAEHVEELRTTLQRLRVQKEDFDRIHRSVRNPDTKAHAAAMAIHVGVTRCMLVYRSLLTWFLEKSEASEDRWFRWRDHVHRICKEDPENAGDKGAARLWRDWERRVSRRRAGGRRDGFELKEAVVAALPRSFDVEWIVHLSYFAFFGGGRHAPIAFHYDRATATIQLDPDSRLSDYLRDEDLPVLAIASLSDRHNFLRLDPITKGRLRHQPLRIAVEYEEPPTKDARPSTHVKGLISKVCEEIARNEVDILFVANKWTRYSYDAGSGRVDFIVDADPSHARAVQDEILRIRLPESAEEEDARAGASAPAQRADQTKLQVTTNKYGILRLFLSYHFGHKRELALQPLIERKARECGFELVTVHGHVQTITLGVVQSMRSADTLLQVYSFAAGEDPETAQFPWLDFEFGQANGLGLPALRMVDTVVRSLGWWEAKIRTQRDVGLKAFRSDVSDADLVESFAAAMRELAHACVEHDDRTRRQR